MNSTHPRIEPGLAGAGRYSFPTFLAWALGSWLAALLLVLRGEDVFAQFFGDAPPVPVVAIIAVIGGACLWLLDLRGWSQPAEEQIGRVLRSTIAAAVGFAALAISFDAVIPFREDMNVEWPESVLYYPTIGFVAETVFHVLPLALIALIMGRRFDTDGGGRRALIAIVLVATSETIFQVAIAISTDAGVASMVFVGLHLFAIGLYELAAFRRFGFVALLSFRISYYLLWHIGWGHLRLSLLF
ncbi:MAG: hypothetical protein WBM50_08435 [Acidimicrobiales bacterium]